ncbi:MAG: flagellar hook assembly protein FlgD [Methylobacterium sp.]|uniref:flagellar hook assembly protein FlgD n=1 Tax=Methylobacterium sp. TaxID=409 RepID=UPI0025852196|nr:flagellar hook capping FlgD N-terminal domain-containing protein [Methylobacterium sp.]MBY0296453.1 flagellar hook assembly protein FlgD [Methylobacterium sp.]
MTAGITTLASAASGTSRSSTTGDAATLAGNFDQFLTLLTTQLRNQNPLDPLDTNQFTQQLVQFASVEQQLKSNDRLDALLSASKASSSASAAGLIGQTVTSSGITAPLSNGAAAWTLNAARAATRATLTIADAKGNVVATQTKALAAGSQTFTWDGRNSTGMLASDGTYTLKVQAFDATGQKVTVDTKVTGVISSVDVSGSDPILTIDGKTVPLSSVQAIGAASGG